MHDLAPLLGKFDPARHDSHLIALFRDEVSAEHARSAVIDAGVPAGRVTMMADGSALHDRLRHPVQDLFVPEDDYHDCHHALGRDHALIIVRPESHEERAIAVWVLEHAEPLSLDEHGRRWRGVAAPVDRLAINHANVSRADMRGRAIGGRDEIILDMTGQKMIVRMMSETDMAEAPFAPALAPERRAAPLAPPPPARDLPVHGTSYTYGVPADIVQRMSPAEQVMAQPHTVEVPGEVPGDKTTRGTFLRVVAGAARVGWRETHPAAPRVRSYVTERPLS